MRASLPAGPRGATTSLLAWRSGFILLPAGLGVPYWLAYPRHHRVGARRRVGRPDRARVRWSPGRLGIGPRGRSGGVVRWWPARELDRGRRAPPASKRPDWLDRRCSSVHGSSEVDAQPVACLNRISRERPTRAPCARQSTSTLPDNRLPDRDCHPCAQSPGSSISTRDDSVP